MLNLAPQACGLYIHVPFCLSKCRYCNFYSIPDRSLADSYLAALKVEMDRASGAWEPFDTVYLGGGTPSVLSIRQIHKILEHAARRFSIAPNAEITLEANPATLNREAFQEYRALGINRLNLGVQAFDNALLKLLGRIHTAQDAQDALAQVRAAGFLDIGADLIFGIPGQTRQQWRESLELMMDFGPEHLSCYMLSFEKGTPLCAMAEKGEICPMPEEEMARMFLFTDHFLASRGYMHYEVSNFARGPEHCSRHNSKYWSGAPYLGLGPSAHSYNGKDRWWNKRSVQGYVDDLQGGRLPQAGRETLTRNEHALETLYLSLRHASGLDTEAFEAAFGIPFEKTFGKAVKDLADQGMVIVRKGRCALTPKGMLYLDAVAALLGNAL